MRLCTVALFTFHIDCNFTTCGHTWPFFYRNKSSWQINPYMTAKDSINFLKPISKFHKIRSTRPCFFGWLESKVYITFNTVFHRDKHLSCTEQNRHVTIVTTSMHLAIYSRFEFEGIMFLYR